ncbi:MAG: hypothetical protein EBU90_23550 [Proteobacteria bacterium]|nr:hypothetical protein [Pseudomonadota bacterium]
MLETEQKLYEIILEEIESILEEEKKKAKVNPAYLKGSPEKKKREKEIRTRAKKDTDDPSAYRPFATDKDPRTGKPIETKPSKWNKKVKDMFGEGTDELDLESLREFISEVLLLEKGDSVTKALKNKAEKSGAPMGALRAIYNKGLAAWRTGHRPGASQHAWAMARVNSVLAGGPARKVDAAQWEKIKKHRGKKKKKK